MSLTLDELWREFDRWAETYYRKPSGRPTSERTNLASAWNHVARWSPKPLVDQCSVAWLRRVRDRMIDQGVSRRVCNAHIHRIRRVFRWGVEHELVPPHVLTSLKSLSALKHGRSAAKERPPIEPVDPEIFARTADAAPQPVRSMMWVQWWTGMRPAELCLMTPGSIDRTREPWVYQPPEHKTEHLGRQRRIALGPRAREWIEPHLEYQGNPYLFPSLQDARPLWRTQRGVRFTPPAYRLAVRRACHRLGVEPWCPLQVRHAAATRLREIMGLDTARTVLGHGRVSTTEIYAQADLDQATDAMELVG